MVAVCGKEDTIMANTNTKTAPRSTKIKESFGSRLFDVVDVLIICLLLACVLIPLIHIVAASFSNPSLFVGHKGILLWPGRIFSCIYLRLCSRIPSSGPATQTHCLLFS